MRTTLLNLPEQIVNALLPAPKSSTEQLVCAEEDIVSLVDGVGKDSQLSSISTFSTDLKSSKQIILGLQSRLNLYNPLVRR